MRGEASVPNMKYIRGGFQPVLRYSQFFLLPVTRQLSADRGPWVFDTGSCSRKSGNFAHVSEFYLEDGSKNSA